MRYIDAEKLIKFVNRYHEDAKAAFNPIEDDADYYKGKIDACEDMQEVIASLKQEEPGVWVKIDADHQLPYGQEVIGYNKAWINEDFNPSGTRIGFLSDVGFHSAKWNNDQDCYDTPCEEGDDYIISQIQPDGTEKIWCKYDNGKAVEGYLPNMPTHFMLIPKTPDGFAWPYNTEKER